VANVSGTAALPFHLAGSGWRWEDAWVAHSCSSPRNSSITLSSCETKNGIVVFFSAVLVGVAAGGAVAAAAVDSADETPTNWTPTVRNESLLFDGILLVIVLFDVVDNTIDVFVLSSSPPPREPLTSEEGSKNVVFKIFRVFRVFFIKG